MDYSIEQGYGWEVAVSDQHLKDFILNHKQTVLKVNEGDEIVKYAETLYMDGFKEDWAEYQQIVYYDEGAYGLIADVMTLETGIDFSYHCPEYLDGTRGEYIMFRKQFPWSLTDAERKLSQEELATIIKRYMTELGQTGVPDFVEAKYVYVD